MAAKKKSQLVYNALTNDCSTTAHGTHTTCYQYAQAQMMQKVATTT